MSSRKFGRQGVTAVLAAAEEDRVAQTFGLNSPTDRRVVEVPIGRIIPNPSQPRRHFDEAELEGLAESIRQKGLVQPIGIKPLDDGTFQLVYGERRLRAAKMVGLEKVVAVTVSGDDDELALIENVQRADLDPFEEADGIERLRRKFDYPYSVLGQILGKSKSEISRALALLKLPQVVRDEYHQHRPTKKQLWAIAEVADPAVQARMWDAVKSGGDARTPLSADPAPVAAVELGKDETAGRNDASGPQDNTGTILSALPKRLARRIQHAREVLGALRQEPKPLWNSDIQMLKEMRDDIDAVIKGAAKQSAARK